MKRAVALSTETVILGTQGFTQFNELNEEAMTSLTLQSRIILSGVLRFELDRGVPVEPQNPYPSLRVILAEKGTHF